MQGMEFIKSFMKNNTNKFVLDPKNWDLAPIEQMSKYYEELKESKRVNAYGAFFSKKLSPLDLYCYLKAKFGEPNGYQMALKDNQTSDNLFHWHYHLVSGKNHVHIMGLTYSIQFSAESDRKLTDVNWRDLVGALSKEFSETGKAKGEITRGLEKWKLFINPFARLTNVSSVIYDELTALHEVYQKTISKKMESNNFLDTHSELFSSLNNLIIKSFSLRRLIPIIAESFVNVLIFLLAKEEIKSNDEKYQKTIRENIDERVLSLHSTCLGFTKGVEKEEMIFKDFCTIMNLRNDFLHGNIDPKKFSLQSVYFDKNIPLFKNSGGIYENVRKTTLKFIEPADVISDYNRVQEFINYILTLLDSKYISSVTAFLDCVYPGWSKLKNKVGILVPNQRCEVFPQIDDSVYFDMFDAE